MGSSPIVSTIVSAEKLLVRAPRVIFGASPVGRCPRRAQRRELEHRIDDFSTEIERHKN